jgi:hypothetical protein
MGLLIGCAASVAIALSVFGVALYTGQTVGVVGADLLSIWFGAGAEIVNWVGELAGKQPISVRAD